MSLQVAFDECSLQEKEAAKRAFFAQGYPRNVQVGQGNQMGAEQDAEERLG